MSKMRIINDQLLSEFRAARKCEWSSKPTPSGCDPHHLWSKGSGRLDIRINLISLSREIHSMVHAGTIKLHDLLPIVAKREKTTVETIKAVVWFIQRLDGKASPEQIAHEIAKLPGEIAQIALTILVNAEKL